MTDTARRCSCNRRINRAAPHLRRDGPNKSCRGSDHPATPSLGRVRRACTASGLSPEEGAERLSVRLRGILPVGLDWTPALAEPFLVGVAPPPSRTGHPGFGAALEPSAGQRGVPGDAPQGGRGSWRCRCGNSSSSTPTPLLKTTNMPLSWAGLGGHLISQPRPFSPRVAAQY